MDIKGLRRRDRQILQQNYEEYEKQQEELDKVKDVSEYTQKELDDLNKAYPITKNGTTDRVSPVTEERGDSVQIKKESGTQNDPNLSSVGNPITPEEEEYYRTLKEEDVDILTKAIRFIEQHAPNINPRERIKDLWKTGATWWNEYVNNPFAGKHAISKFFTLAESNMVPIVGPALGAMDIANNLKDDVQSLEHRNALNKALQDDSWVKDAFSSWVQKKNTNEVEKYAGNILRNDERKSYAKTMYDYMQSAKDLIDVYDRIQKGDSSTETLQRFRNIQSQLDQLKEYKDVANSYNLDDGLFASYMKRAEVSVLDNFLERIKKNDRLNERQLQEFKLNASRIQNSYSTYINELDEKTKDDFVGAQKNINELRDWERWHTISDDYLRKEKQAQQNLLSDVDTYLYGMPGIMGSSASFNTTQLLGMGLNTIGQGLMMVKNPYAAAAGLVTTLAGAGVNIASGENENDAEVASNYKEGLISSLQKAGIYEDFIKDGKQQLDEKGIYYKDDDEVVTNFILKRWFPNNKQAKDIAINRMFGAQNLFERDMVATTADVIIDTSLSVFAPYGPLSKISKLTPIPKKEVLKRWLGIKYGGAAKQTFENLTKETGVGRSVADAISPVLGGGYRITRAALTPATYKISKALEPWANKLTSHIDDAFAWTKAMPKTIAATKKTAGNAIDFAGRTLVRGFSESVEEGKQHEYGERYANGEFGGKNTNMLELALDDLSTGTNVGFLFLGHQLLGLEADEKLMAEMRGGFLGGLLNQNTFISTYHAASGTIKDVHASNVLYNNFALQKYNDRSAIINGETFARYHTSSDYDRMMKTFDDIESVVDKSYNSSMGLTKESVEQQREEYKKIYRLVNSRVMKSVAEERGIKAHSKDYNTLAGLIHYLNNTRNESRKLFNDTITSIQEFLDSNTVSQKSFNNIQELIDKNFEDESLSDQQKGYLQKLRQEIINENPQITNEQLANTMRTQIMLEREGDQRLAQYMAYRHLMEELEWMKMLSPEEYHNHAHKMKVYQQMLKTFMSDDVNKSFIEGIGLADDVNFETARDYATNVEVYDTLIESYRQLAQSSAQLQDINSTWQDILGDTSASMMYLDEDEVGSDYITNKQLKDVLNIVRAYNKQATIGGKAALKSEIRKGAEKTKAFIERYRESVKSDEQLIEDINKDFYEHRNRQPRPEVEQVSQQTEPETDAAFNELHQDTLDFAKTKTKSRLQQDELMQKLLIPDETGTTSAQRVNDLVDDNDQMYEISDSERTIYTRREGDESDEVIVEGIPVSKKYTHVAVRKDNTLVYLTNTEAEFYKYLYNRKNPKPAAPKKGLYVSPETTVSEYEDDILDAIVSKDKSRFEKIFENIKKYASEEKIDYIAKLWDEANKEQVVISPDKNQLVPVGKRTRRQTISELRGKSKNISKKIRSVLNSVFSLVTLFDTYSQLIPKTEDETAEYLSRLNKDLAEFLNTLEEKNRKSVKQVLARKDQDQATNQQKVDLYIRAGFQIVNDTRKARPVYLAVAPTGESYKINATQYKYAMWAKYYKNRNIEEDPAENIPLVPETPAISTRSLTEKQKAAVDILKSKLAYDNPQIVRIDLRTGWDYFFVENGKLVRYNRVHSKIAPQYEKYKAWREDYTEIKRELESVFDDKKRFEEKVIEYENRWNDELARIYGKNSTVYDYHKISLRTYLLNEIITDRKIIDSIAHIAAIKKHIEKDESGKEKEVLDFEVASRSVIAGQIIDKICRDFFAGRTVVNKPKYMLPDRYFDKLIKQLTKQKEIYDGRGWHLITDPLCWRAVVDGQRIAGETDMVAVDENGKLHIIDFKTSKYSFKEEEGEVIPVLGEQGMLTVQKTIPALDHMTKSQSRTAKNVYTDQQTFYANMIRADLQGLVEVESVELLGFQVRTRAGKNQLGEYDESVFDGFVSEDTELNSNDDNMEIPVDGVELQNSVQLSFSQNINNLSFVNRELNDAQSQLNYLVSGINAAFLRLSQTVQNQSEKITDQSKQQLELLRRQINQINSNANTSDLQTCRKTISDSQTTIGQLQDLEVRVNNEIQQYDASNPPVIPEKPRLNSNRKVSLGQTILYNCLDMFNENFVNKDLQRVSALPDFMRSAVFEIDVDTYEKTRVYGGKRIATPTCYVTITYDEHLSDGSVKHHKFDKIKLLFARSDGQGKRFDQNLDGQNASPLLAKIESLLANPENKGKRIVLTNGSRTNGIVKYNSISQQRPAQEVFGISEDQMETMLDGDNGNILAIVKRGQVYKTQSTRSQLIPLHGVDPDRALTDGMMVWYLNLGYDEDEGSGEHSVPITLTPKELDDSDVNFIVDLLKNITKKRKININGREYDCPISNSRLLRSIVRFGKGAEEIGNRFIFDWANTNELGFSTDEYRTVRIAKKKQGTEDQFDFDYVVDLHNDDDINNKLIPALKQLYVYSNNEYAMRHATSSKRDASNNNKKAPMTNPFVGLEYFFKQHPELTKDNEDVEIKFSNSLVFRRSDVDPKLDGSYEGITGAHWMMKNGWFITNFDNIILPMISFTDAEVLNKPTIEEVTESSIEEAKSGNEVIEDIKEEDEWHFEWNDDPSEPKLQFGKPEVPLNREQALRRLHKILGTSFPIEFLSNAYDVLESGWSVVAACKTNAIILTDEAENGVEFHEAFHAVVDLLIGENRRKRIYNIYNQKYGENRLNDNQISEGLADLYYEFRQETQIDWNSGILNVFKQIANWVRYLYNLNDVRLAWLFVQTNVGWFRNRVADPESIKSFMQRNKRGYEPYAVRIGTTDIQLPHFISQRQVNDAIDSVIYRLIRDYGIDNIAGNIEQLQTTKDSITAKDSKFRKTYLGFTLAGVTEEQIDNAIQNGKKVDGRVITQADKDKIMKFRDIFEHWDELHPIIEQKLKMIGVDTVLKRKKKDVEDKQGGNIISESIDAHSDAFYEHSRSEDVSAKVRYLLSTLPSVRYVTEEDIASGATDINGVPYKSIYRLGKDGNVLYDANNKPIRATIPMSRNTLGMITFQSFNEVYQKLLKQLYDVEDVADLLNRLEELGQEDYVFYHIKKSLYDFRRRSYQRHENGAPKVMLDGKLLSPEIYISNVENMSEREMYPTVVRYSRDVINDDGQIEHHRGEIIENAIILTNPDYESLATLIFQAIKSQHLDFTFTYASPVINEDGEIEGGKRKYNTASTSQESGTATYPLLWFNRLRTLHFGLIKTQDGVPVIDKESSNKDVFKNTKEFLLKLQSQFAPNRRHKMDLGYGRSLDIDNKEDFDRIETLFISHLNKIGISIDKNVLNYMFRTNNPNRTLQESFEYMFTSNEDSSIQPFIRQGGVLDQLQKAVDEGDVSKFIEDVNTKENRKANIKARRQGSYLYALNGFIISLAIGASKYDSFYKESMTIGPGNTKMYTFAENHSASDTTYELNNALDQDGNTKSGNIMDDLKNVSYVTMENDGVRIGSIIAKFVLDPSSNPSHNKIVLHTHSGLKMTDSREGGVKYSEIKAREDYISKAQILRDGGIIFPTLSDKSTWFYLSGIKLPGLNWQSKNVEEFGLLPVPGKVSGRLFYQNEETIGDFRQNSVLDQMIEYAMCELANIEKTIDDLGLNEEQAEASKEGLPDNKKVKNYHTLGKKDENGNVKDAGMHGARFFFLTGVYDERDGKYIEFNKVIKSDPDLGVTKCYKLAKQYFFDKVVSPKTGKLETDEELRCRQRSQIANILQHRLDEELDRLVDLGIIEFNPKQTQYSMVKPGSSETKPDKLPQYFGYVNKMLDEADIEYLTGIYAAMYKGKYGLSQCRSLAVVAYVNDILAKSIMSIEETERIFTGMPQFFKCIYDNEGHLVDRGEDESKRFGGEGSTGSNNRSDLPNISEEYSCAEIKDWEISSSLKDTLGEAFRLDEYREALSNKLVDELRASGEYTLQKEKEIYDDVYSRNFEDIEKEFTEEQRNIIDAKIAAESDSYKKDINVADGTAYITDKMAENLLRQLGKYTGKVQEAFEYLRNQKAPTSSKKEGDKIITTKETRRNAYLTNAKAYRIIHNALISTQKYSAFGFRMENGLPVHFYNKFALFPLFEGISYGFTKRLYDKMNDSDNPVDMVMFDSAVKSGSEGAQKFNPDMSEEELNNFTFAGHIYKQKYKFIRRQLNTDPRTDEEMAFGTQVLKIALSTLRDGQTYTLSDGTEILGVDLKARIMDYQKRLAEIGKAKIDKEFFKNGKADIESFSQFIEKELVDRNANKNILDAIKVHENENGEKEFEVDLNSVSSLSWIESILNSHINNEVIDINMPGNAYYQRSVFGMEGITEISDDELDQRFVEINGGQPLQMINKDGSMDAVISIDYFMHLIPSDIRYDFKKARQFLIDNKIIGPDADTSTIAYRIPTQAVSSVHALKFVDVLPIVRDTIVLPKEFTKITGSDFDIDKLYLTTFNYELDKKGRKIIREFDEDSPKQIQNQMMECYMSLICDAGKQVTSGQITKSRYMHMLHRSIDNDTSLIKKVLTKIESGQQRSTYEPFQYASLARQVMIKNAFMTGKRGIGPYALNNNNHILTMLYNVSFTETEDGILDVIGMRTLSRSLDRDGNSILSWISAMINAHVDVAKDPYILRLNINEYTYNLSNLMLRIGLGQDTLYFTAQPIMKELAQIYENANGSLVEDPNLTSKQRYDQLEAVYMSNLGFTDPDIKSAILAYVGNNLPKSTGYIKSEDRADQIKKFNEKFNDVIKALFSVSENGEYVREFTTTDGKIVKGVSILEDLLTNPNVRIDAKKPVSINNLSTKLRYKIGNKMYSPKEMQAFVFIAKMRLNEYAEQLSNLVTYTKIDTKKQGINYQEQRAYRDSYDAIHDEYEKAAEENRSPRTLFDQNVIKMLDESFIHIKTVYGTTILKDILGNYVMHMQDSFQELVDGIAENIGRRSGKIKASIQRSLITYIKQKCMNQCMKDNNIDFKPLIFGQNTLASRIDALKEKMLSDTTGKYTDFVVNGNFINTLLRNIHGVPYIPPYGQDRYDVLTLDNIQSDDQQTENDYIDSWQQLLDSDDEEIRQIGNDLAIYAFMTSGDNSGFTKFFKYVPLSWRESIGYCENISRWNQALRDGIATLDGNPNSFYNIDTVEFIRNNWTNTDIVPQMSPYRLQYKTRQEIEDSGNSKPYYVKNFTGHTIRYGDLNLFGQEVDRNVDQVIAGIIPYKNSFKITISKRNNKFPLFVKIKRRGASFRDADPYMLYKLVDVATHVDDKGTIFEYPIYALTYPGGFSIKALGQRFDMYEYERDDDYTHIFSEEAMIGDNYGDRISDICDQMEQYVRSHGQLPKTLVPLLEERELVEIDENGNKFYNLEWDRILRDLYKARSGYYEQNDNVVPEAQRLNGENISSRGSEFAKLLTNPGNNLQVEYKGKTFRNAEHAYQTWKSGEFDDVAYNSTAFIPRGQKPANKETSFQTMVEILIAKLQQHPELVEGINERGGMEYLQNSTHVVFGDRFWESGEGKENGFIRALIQAYQNVNEQFEQQHPNQDRNRITAQYGVIIDPNLKKNWQAWQQDHPEGIVAYRVNFNEYNTPKEANAGRIGNPFSEGVGDVNKEEETVKRFYTWLTKGTTFGNPKATEEYRQAIIQRILNTPEGAPILYYKELGRPSHATVIGYLVNNKDILLQQTDDKPKLLYRPIYQFGRVYLSENDKKYITEFVHILDIYKETTQEISALRLQEVIRSIYNEMQPTGFKYIRIPYRQWKEVLQISPVKLSNGTVDEFDLYDKRNNEIDQFETFVENELIYYLEENNFVDTDSENYNSYDKSTKTISLDENMYNIVKILHDNVDILKILLKSGIYAQDLFELIFEHGNDLYEFFENYQGYGLTIQYSYKDSRQLELFPDIVRLSPEQKKIGEQNKHICKGE